jgi:membrane-bound metal-dependent hydrolase YbcI (DUF457 family)
MPIHRTVTHSIPVAVLLTIIAVAVTGKVNLIRQKGRKARRQEGESAQGPHGRGAPFCLPGIAIGLAWTSHVLMDWLDADANPPYGIQLFWPFSDRWYFSG